MLETEELLQAALNEAGALATGECLKDFDSDGGAIVITGEKLTVKGGGENAQEISDLLWYDDDESLRLPEQRRGSGLLSLEANARIMRTATPLLAKQVSVQIRDLRFLRSSRRLRPAWQNTLAQLRA
ncbi:MAG: hypothetical protein R3F19_11335 [Verrucomicrobiales bacterium]